VVHENLFIASAESNSSTQAGRKTILVISRTLKRFRAEENRKIDDTARTRPDMQRKLQSSRVFDGDLFFRMMAAPKLFWQNRTLE
jgi:hypothetical protein